jgi:hypothetical protein
MRLTTIAIAASLLLLPAAVPAFACGAAKVTAQAAANDLSAAKKPMKKTKKKTKKKKAEKVEYMRAVPAK